MTIQEAVQRLVKELKEDKGYFYGWQSNIAMAFVDELNGHGISFPTLHKLSNQAAINFLNLLCRPVKPEVKP